MTSLERHDLVRLGVLLFGLLTLPFRIPVLIIRVHFKDSKKGPHAGIPVYCYPALLGARVLRAVRIFGDRDYEHFLFKMWLKHDHEVRTAKALSPTGRQFL